VLHLNNPSLTLFLFMFDTLIQLQVFALKLNGHQAKDNQHTRVATL